MDGWIYTCNFCLYWLKEPGYGNNFVFGVGIECQYVAFASIWMDFSFYLVGTWFVIVIVAYSTRES
jgi:hypothetical protein